MIPFDVCGLDRVHLAQDALERKTDTEPGH